MKCKTEDHNLAVLELLFHASSAEAVYISFSRRNIWDHQVVSSVFWTFMAATVIAWGHLRHLNFFLLILGTQLVD